MKLDSEFNCLSHLFLLLLNYTRIVIHLQVLFLSFFVELRSKRYKFVIIEFFFSVILFNWVYLSGRLFRHGPYLTWNNIQYDHGGFHEQYYSSSFQLSVPSMQLVFQIEMQHTI